MRGRGGATSERFHTFSQTLQGEGSEIYELCFGGILNLEMAFAVLGVEEQ